MPEPRPAEDAGTWIHAALERYEGPLVAYATRLLDGDLERARDSVQETFLRLCNQRRDAVENHLAEWLYTVCRNQTLDVRRKESRMSELNGVELPVAACDAATTAVDVRDSADHVLSKLCALPPKQQEVLRLKFQHGLSYKEIGRVMDETVGTVGWLIHTGIRNLRGELASEGVEA